MVPALTTSTLTATGATPKAIALLLHESPVAVRLRGHGADLDTAAAIAGAIGNDDAAMLLASLDKKRRDGQKGWVSSTTLARILSHYPASARAKPGSKSGKSVVHATYKGVRYWNRKLVASLQCRMDDVDAMPLTTTTSSTPTIRCSTPSRRAAATCRSGSSSG